MKAQIFKYFSALLLLLVPFLSQAQYKYDNIVLRDSIKVRNKRASNIYQMAYVALPVITAGFIIKGQDKNFRNLRDSYVPSFRYYYDDFLQYLPGITMYGLKICGVEGYSSWKRMITTDVLASCFMIAAVESLKSTSKVTRPDGSNRKSFPSGHTAIAFMTATMVHKEYGLTRSPWYSVGAYSVATTVAVSRIMNNKHWMSDVLVGAGVGVLSTEIGYYLSELIFKERGIVRNYLPIKFLPNDFKPSFLGLYVGFNEMIGNYKLLNDTKFKFSAGSNAGAEGAWFFNQNFGIGGRATVSGMYVSMKGDNNDRQMHLASGYIGGYYSLNIGGRWFIGTKMLFGCNYSSEHKLSDIKIGGRCALSAGTGVNLRYITYNNMGVKFFTDYNMMDSLLESGGQLNHQMTIGGSVDICF
jgi:hypothetical protein